MAQPKVKQPLPAETEVTAASGPLIEYIGEGAALIKFSINPKATRYVVNANGMIKEYL